MNKFIENTVSAVMKNLVLTNKRSKKNAASV